MTLTCWDEAVDYTFDIIYKSLKIGQPIITILLYETRSKIYMIIFTQHYFSYQLIQFGPMIAVQYAHLHTKYNIYAYKLASLHVQMQIPYQTLQNACCSHSLEVTMKCSGDKPRATSQRNKIHAPHDLSLLKVLPPLQPVYTPIFVFHYSWVLPLLITSMPPWFYKVFKKNRSQNWLATTIPSSITHANEIHIYVLHYFFFSSKPS